MAATVADWHVVVPHHAQGARLARQRLAAHLEGTVSDDLLSDAVAVTAELVGNAVRHARGLPGDVVDVTWRLVPAAGGCTVVIRVEDGGSASDPQVRSPAPEALDGRGLAIVAALAERWGAVRTRVGQAVWAELRDSGPGRLTR